MSKLKTDYSKPIEFFKDIQAGDILMHLDPTDPTDDHIMLFDEFTNYDPASGLEPDAGTTFWVYESIGDDPDLPDDSWKVRHHLYTLEQAPTIDSSTNNEVVEIVGLDGEYEPRIYNDLIPLDVVLVIDTSTSMQNQEIEAAKEAAKEFVFQMRPEDKIGVVTYSDFAESIYSLQLITEFDTDGDGIENEKDEAIFHIDHITAGGATNIGAGLERAR